MIPFPCITIIDDTLLSQALQELDPVTFKVFMYLVHHAQNYEEIGDGHDGEKVNECKTQLNLEYNDMLDGFIKLRQMGWLDAFAVCRGFTYDPKHDPDSLTLCWRMGLLRNDERPYCTCPVTLLEDDAKTDNRQYSVIGTEIIPQPKSRTYNRHWRRIRPQVLERDGHKCIECNSTIRLHVHHLTYEHEGKEHLEDLVTLCGSCHSKKKRRDRGGDAGE